MIFNRKNKIIGFKPDKQALEEKFHSRLLEHSSENCQKSYRKYQKKPEIKLTIRTNEMLQTLFMTEIIFIVVKTKRTNLGQPIWRDTPRDEDCLVENWKPIQLFIGKF